MESGCSLSLRRPRTHTNRKARLWTYLVRGVQKDSRLHISHDQNLSKPLKRRFLIQDVDALRKKAPARRPLTHGFYSHRGIPKAEKGVDNQKLKASHRKYRQRERPGSHQKCFQETIESSHASIESDVKGSLVLKDRATPVNSDTVTNKKGLNDFVRQSHDNDVNCKPGFPSRTESHRSRVAPRKTSRQHLDKDKCFRQQAYYDISWEQSSTKNVCCTDTAVGMWKTELECSTGKRLESKPFQGKKSAPFKAYEILYQPDECACSKQGIEKSSTTKKSSFVPEARRHQHKVFAQNFPTNDLEMAIPFKNKSSLQLRRLLQDSNISALVIKTWLPLQMEIKPDNVQVWEEEDSGDDAISDSNGPVVVKLEKAGFRNSQMSDAYKDKALQLPMIRKSSRIPKKRLFDEDDKDDDDEAPMQRWKKKLESELPIDHTEQEESTDGVVNEENANAYCRRESTGFMSEDQHTNECNERESANIADKPCLLERNAMVLTARQRALRTMKEGGESEVTTRAGFPDILQQVLSKRHKEKLTDAEQAIKKEEAARRRRQQTEKNAKETQAVAMQKILGQESSRKKREEKLQKQRQEIEQEKQAAATAPPVSSIRWVMGPCGNVVSFSQDIELPTIFSGPCSYPQEREKCAGPSCNNAYRYRDSKTLLPLCSLQCYRAVQGIPTTGPAF